MRNVPAVFLSFLFLFATSATAGEKPTLLEYAKAGSPGAQHALCYGYLYGVEGLAEDTAAAFKWCSAAAARGWADSQTLLAEMYRFGTHVARDDDRARELYRLAAVQGHAHAQFMLGYMALLERAPTSANAFEACYWLRSAESRGYEKASRMLGNIESRWREEHAAEDAGFCDRALDKGRSAGSGGGAYS